MARRQLRIVHTGEPRPSALARPAGDIRSLLDSPGLGAVLQRGLTAIVKLSGARGGAIRLLAPDGRKMRLLSSVGLPPGMVLKERVVGLDCGICGLAFQSDGIELDPQPRVCARRMSAGDGACGPVLAVPLHCGGKVIGVFNLFFGEPSRVPEDLTELIEPASQMLDLVLDNAVREHERLHASLAAERQMLAGEVHDSLAQGLAYMRMRMTLAQDAVRNDERAHALKYLQDVNDAMGEAHARLRELITQFRHVVDEGLVAALASTARTFEDRTGIELAIDNRAAQLRLAPEHEAQVYQIVQEALANVVKHAGARKARIVLQDGPRGVSITVEDDGCGVPRKARAGRADAEHYGLDIMRERAQRIGASLEIRSAPGRGTRVRVLLPARLKEHA